MRASGLGELLSAFYAEPSHFVVLWTDCASWPVSQRELVVVQSPGSRVKLFAVLFTGVAIPGATDSLEGSPSHSVLYPAFLIQC